MVAPTLKSVPKQFWKSCRCEYVRLEKKSVISGHRGAINALNYWHKKVMRGIFDFT
jgi:hypothetical protein